VVIEDVCMSHYAANFLIYAATGLNFRSELRALLRRTCPCLVTCFRRATGTGNKHAADDAASTLEMRQTIMTPLRSGNGCRRVVELSDTEGSHDRKPSDDVMATSTL